MPEETNVEELKQKRRELVAPIRKLKSRKRQKEERPALLDKLISTVEEAEKKLQMFHGSKEFFADGELDAFGNQISVVKSWLEAVKRELDQLQDNQDASFSTDDLKTKTNSVKCESKNLSTKYTNALKQREEETEKAKKMAKAEQNQPQQQNNGGGGEKMEVGGEQQSPAGPDLLDRDDKMTLD